MGSIIELYMKHNYFWSSLVIICFVSQGVYAQNDEDVVVKINDVEVQVKEFKRVYLKNLELVQDDTREDVTSYLDLYIDYKLKVQEAYRQELDKKRSFQNEFKGYKKQLSRGFLTDVSVSDALVREAYDRTLEERNARHILIRVSPAASPEDTLKAHTKINEARAKILGGEDFNTVARQYSEDPSAQNNGGELGWFKAFGMVYPFETATYMTAVGTVSKPFRTSFGYHIVQPTASRQSKGRVKVTHIMIAHRQKDSTINPEQRIKELYALLNQSISFEDLARQYSDDKRSAANGGVLLPFAQGQLSSTEFEEQAFALEEGATSQPFRTDFGWHIVRLLAKIPVGSLDKERPKLEDRLKKDSRAKVISDSLMYKLRKRYGITINEALLTYYNSTITDDVITAGWKLDTLAPEMNKTALSLRDTLFTFKDVGQYLEQQQGRYSTYPSKEAFIKGGVQQFEDERIKSYHETHLEEVDPDFAAILNEYREGLLLFDLMESKVWNKAKTDSIGVQQYFDKHSEKYTWPKRITYTEGRASQEAHALQARRMLEEGKSVIDIESALNTKDVVNILFTTKTEPFNTGALPVDLSRTVGLSSVIHHQNYVFYQITDVIESKPKILDEARGQVLGDYQSEIERRWMEGLRTAAEIKINKKVVKRLEKAWQ